MNPTSPPPRSPPALPPSVFWPTIWLAVVLVTIKATYVKKAAFWEWAGPADLVSWLYLQWVAAASQADLWFALGSGTVAALALRLIRDHPKSRLLVRGFLAFAVCCIWYAVASREFFATMGAPLTYQILSLGGNLGTLSSSLTAHLTVPVIVALGTIPIGYLAASAWSGRVARRRSSRVRSAGRILALAGFLCWILIGRQLLGTPWFTYQDRHVPENPHWIMVESFALEALGLRPSLGAMPVTPEEVCRLREARLRPSASPIPILPGQPGSRNLIVLVLESVGTQFIEPYGGPAGLTPRLNAERNNSLIFDAYYAPVGWTSFSLEALLLSRQPALKGYNTRTFSLSASPSASLANVLSEHGYATAFFAAGDPDWASRSFFENRGFDTVLRGDELPGSERLTSWGVKDQFVFDQLIEWIGKHRDRPFFVMAWSDQTHHPYRLAPGQTPWKSLPEGWKSDDGSLSRYLTLLHETDALIGRLLDTLRARGLAEKTVVAITGDHGEAFGRYHQVRAHGFSLYEEEVRVPLLLWNPALFRGGHRVATVGSHLDLGPSLLEILGVTQPPDWEGLSLFTKPDSGPVFLFSAGWGERVLGIRNGPWKYIFDARRGVDELYLLSRDPHEQMNLAGEEPDRSQQFRRQLAVWMRATGEGTRSAPACEGSPVR